MQFKIPFTNKFVEIKIDEIPELATLGITNHTPDNYFVPFFDYDAVEPKVIEEDVDFFQKNFDIGTVVVVTSSEEKTDGGSTIGNYHVIGFTKFTYPKIKEMLKLSRCDPTFKTHRGWEQRCWVLRVLDKKDWNGVPYKPIPKFKKIIPFKTSKICYRALVIFIEQLYGIKLRQYFKHFDRSKNIEIINYATFKSKKVK